MFILFICLFMYIIYINRGKEENQRKGLGLVIEYQNLGLGKFLRFYNQDIRVIREGEEILYLQNKKYIVERKGLRCFKIKNYYE